MKSLLSLVPGTDPAEAALVAAGGGVAAGPTYITTNDGCRLSYQRYGKPTNENVIVLVHGWSGSRHYFDLNARPLSRHCTVYTYDQRHHGESDKPGRGYHVARLASDLQDLLVALDLRQVTVVGTSMGCAVIWSYLEIFGEERLAKAVFVDQAPLQNTAADWKCGSTGCYDIASLTRLQCKLQSDFAGFAKDNGDFCATLPLGAEVKRVLEQETMKADPQALALLMADHTALDWRPLLPHIKIPCLNIVGRKSAVFPWWGCEVVGKLIPNCHTVFFEESNHWLYIEEPDKFNKLVGDFAANGFLNVTKVLHL